MQNYCIRLLSWVLGEEANVGIRVQDLGLGYPAVGYLGEPFPRQLARSSLYDYLIRNSLPVLTGALVLQRYEGSREPMQQADNAFQERDFWKETRHGRQHDS